MFTNNKNSTPKTGSAGRRLAHVLLLIDLALLALIVVASPASPTSAAGSQPQLPQDHPTAPNTPSGTCPQDGQCFADVPPASPFYTFTNNIFQQGLVTGFPCGGPGEPCDAQNRPYYRPVNNVTRQQMAKFIDNARNLPGMHIVATDTNPLVYVDNSDRDALVAHTAHGFALFALSDNYVGIFAGSHTSEGLLAESESGNAVQAHSQTGAGVYGCSNPEALNCTGLHVAAGVYGVGNGSGGPGVFGDSAGTGVGVNGYSVAGNGVVGFSGSGGTGYGVFGYSATNRAGHFVGNVDVTGNLSKGGGSFKIDDPLDPANKYLYHSFVESPDMMNVYNGNVMLDAQGEAVVTLPDYFNALNRDFRYQLTPVGAPGPDLYVSEEIAGNHFKIAGGKPGSKVSWQVTGIRQDPYANAHRIPVEEDKPANEQGKYLYPTEEGQPASMGVDYEQEQQIEQAAQPQTKP